MSLGLSEKADNRDKILANFSRLCCLIRKLLPNLFEKMAYSLIQVCVRQKIPQ